MNATNVHIFYTDPMNGWCAQDRDDEGNEVSSAYSYRKVDAISLAKRSGLPVYVYGKNGLFQRRA